MQHFPKEKLALFFVILSLILFIFMLLVTTNTITNVSGLQTEGVGIYRDSNCTDRVPSIEWGTFTPGSVKSIFVYIRNEVEEPIYLIMSTTNWNPSNASDYITLSWDYTRQQINPGKALRITLTLSVSRYIEGIPNFSFDILISGSDRLLGDVNGDGVVDIRDVKIVKLAYSEVIVEPSADINGDGKINIIDVELIKLIFSGIVS